MNKLYKSLIFTSFTLSLGAFVGFLWFALSAHNQQESYALEKVPAIEQAIQTLKENDEQLFIKSGVNAEEIAKLNSIDTATSKREVDTLSTRVTSIESKIKSLEGSVSSLRSKLQYMVSPLL